VVIAIIGILSSVVLASLNSARNKGNDAKVKAQLSGLRAAAEIYYDSNSDYGSAVAGVCPTTAGASGAANMFQDPVVFPYVNDAPGENYPTGVTVVCRSNGTAYAVSANLPSLPPPQVASVLDNWCVDSVGNSKAIAAPVTGTVCP
jgi:type II secretory pathway pseudopilin PulG